MLQNLWFSLGQGGRFILIFIVLCLIYAGLRRVISKKKKEEKIPK